MKKCDRGLFKARSQFFTIRTDPKPVNNLFISFCVQKTEFNFDTRTKSHESVTVAHGQI